MITVQTMKTGFISRTQYIKSRIGNAQGACCVAVQAGQHAADIPMNKFKRYVKSLE